MLPPTLPPDDPSDSSESPSSQSDNPSGPSPDNPEERPQPPTPIRNPGQPDANELAQRVGRRFAECDLRLMPPTDDVGEILTEGKNRIILATVKDVLHFRIFDDDGQMVEDMDETKLTAQTEAIEDLREQYKRLRPPHELTRREKVRVIVAITSVVGYTRFEEEPKQAFRDLNDPQKGNVQIVDVAWRMARYHAQTGTFSAEDFAQDAYLEVYKVLCEGEEMFQPREPDSIRGFVKRHCRFLLLRALKDNWRRNRGRKSFDEDDRPDPRPLNPDEPMEAISQLLDRVLERISFDRLPVRDVLVLGLYSGRWEESPFATVWNRMYEEYFPKAGKEMPARFPSEGFIQAREEDIIGAIASELGLTRKQFLTVFHRMKERLRELLGDYWEELLRDFQDLLDDSD
jgi:hypothetical protein